MDPAALDAYLSEQRTCRIATIGSDGSPHLTPLWFWWDGRSIWFYSLFRSQRWTDLQRDPRVAVMVDGGHNYFELKGVEIRGRVEFVGEVPRVGEPHPELEQFEAKFAHKYFDLAQLPYDHRHAWFKVHPDKISSWDFRKIPT